MSVKKLQFSVLPFLTLDAAEYYLVFSLACFRNLLVCHYDICILSYFAVFFCIFWTVLHIVDHIRYFFLCYCTIPNYTVVFFNIVLRKQ